MKTILKAVYEKHYKILIFFTFFILLLALSQVAYQTITTGDFITKGVSLKGGVTVTINKQTDFGELSGYLSQKFPDADISVRELSSARGSGIIIEASDIDANMFVDSIADKLSLHKEEYSVEIMGGSLGASFFKETLRIILIAFIFMGVVVFYFFGDSWKSKAVTSVLATITIFLVYAGTSLWAQIAALIMGIILIGYYAKYSIPSFAVVLCAVSDIIVTIAVINLLGIKVSTAGIAAILMLIGYSVDTDILLSTKVLKRRQGTSVVEAIYGALPTGLMMTLTTIVAVVAGLVLGQSDVLKQMMTILLCGLIADMAFTWIQNAGILRWYLERKEKSHHG